MMNRIQHVGVVPGDGLVARVGRTVVLLADAAAPATGFGDAVLALLLAAEGGAEPEGIPLAWEIAGLISRRPTAELSAFGLVTASGDDWVILLLGPVWARVTGPGGEYDLTGESAATWSDHLVTTAVDQISLTLAQTTHPAPDPRSDLRAGSVPGHGFRLLVAGVDQAPRALAKPEPDPLPGLSAEPGREQEPGRLDLLPDAPARATVDVSLGEVGVLRADDGMQLILDREYVFGRDPQDEPSVRSGAASPVVLTDPESLISRVQAFVSVTSGVVTVRDAESANGTFVAAPGDVRWTRVTSPTQLKPGWSLRVGKRVFMFIPSDHATPTPGQP